MKGFIKGFTFLATLSSVRNQENKELLACNPGYSNCADNSRCVLYTSLCDFRKDCDDLSDENFKLCQKIQGRRGPCTSRQWQHPSYGCQDISAICPPGRYGNSEPFLSLCNEIKTGLEPFEEITAVQNEISTIRREESNLKDIFEHLAASFNESSWSINDSVCPPLYVNIGGKCMAFFTVAKVNWAEAKQFCESISGQLAMLRTIKDYESLLKHLKSQNLGTDFWIGGRFATLKSADSSSWTWLDDKEIALGAPFWSLYQTPNCTTRGTSPVCYSYSLAPRENRDGFCLALDYAFHYYFIDQNCYEKRSPLCFHNDK